MPKEKETTVVPVTMSVELKEALESIVALTNEANKEKSDAHEHTISDLMVDATNEFLADIKKSIMTQVMSSPKLSAKLADVIKQREPDDA